MTNLTSTRITLAAAAADVEGVENHRRDTVEQVAAFLDREGYASQAEEIRAALLLDSPLEAAARAHFHCGDIAGEREMNSYRGDVVAFRLNELRRALRSL